MAKSSWHTLPGKILFILTGISVFLIWTRYNWSIQNHPSQIIYGGINRAKLAINSANTISESINNLTNTANATVTTAVTTPTSNINVTIDTHNSTTVPEKLKYILIWTDPNHDPLMYLGKGQEVFIQKKCPVQNCFIATDRKTLPDITDFDVILFNGPEVVNKRRPVLPNKRSPKQNYVFASIESSDYYPVCDIKFDGYFNISWTYKLDSDISYGYIVVRNETGEIIGPKREMHWMNINDMKPINDTVKQKLSRKKKLAAWMVSNCYAPNGRNNFVKKIQRHLKKLDGDWTVDVYGDCGTFRCERKDMLQCLQIFEDDYYFYFSFENSFTEDYVTEKVLNALKHYTVPVVYGTANYTRFMPDGIYLNAKELGAEGIAEKMVEIVKDKELYYQFFKWLNHYSYHALEESPETDFHCLFCAGMNNNELMSKTTIIQNFKEWWNPPKIRPGPCPLFHLADLLLMDPALLFS